MDARARLAGFAAVLAVVAGGAWVTGSVARPAAQPRSTASAGAGMEHGGKKEKGGHGGMEMGGRVAGLASSEGGYTFAPARTTVPVGHPTPFTFRILDPHGHAVRRFALEHERRLHLIVVRRDTSDFQHVHPTMAADGTWRVPLRLAAAGSYRAFADFTPAGGKGLTLGVDLSAPGDFRPREYAASRTSDVDGYRVRLAGDLTPGHSSTLRLTVTRDGRAVRDLQPYLGAYGHLVALRRGDLAYLHVHPEGEPGDGTTTPGPTVVFAAQVPSAGGYRLFLDFRHAGEVHTAEFTVTARGE